jgi:hypothetical protein
MNLKQLPILHRELFINGEWSKEYIQKLIDNPSEPEDYPNALIDLYNCLNELDLSEKNILVVGSITPWIESYLLNLGASHINITDVNPIQINDDRISFIHFSELLENKYDIIISFSSVEHIGLGRYGDELDEDGDLKFMNSSSKLLKNKGIFILGIPVAEQYKVDGHWHRIYDENRLNILIEKYKLLKSSKNGKVTTHIDFSFDNFYQYDWQNQPVIFLIKK